MNDLTQPYPYNNEYEEKMTNARPYTATACRQQKTDTKRGEQNKKLGIVNSITIKHMYSVPDRVLYSLLLPAGSSSSGIPYAVHMRVHKSNPSLKLKKTNRVKYKNELDTSLYK